MLILLTALEKATQATALSNSPKPMILRVFRLTESQIRMCGCMQSEQTFIWVYVLTNQNMVTFDILQQLGKCSTKINELSSIFTISLQRYQLMEISALVSAKGSYKQVSCAHLIMNKLGVAWITCLN